MFQLNHNNTLVNKHRQKDGQGHLPFSNEKLLLLLFNFCSLGTLDLQSSNSDPSTRSNHRANIQIKQQDTTKNNTPKQKKGFKKSVLKDRARYYGYESSRNAKNGAKTAILWDKRCFRDLVAINYRVEYQRERFARHSKLCSQRITRS